MGNDPLDDFAEQLRPARRADRGPWPQEPPKLPREAPTLEERVRRIEVALWSGGEAPTWVLDAVADELADEPRLDRRKDVG